MLVFIDYAQSVRDLDQKPVNLDNMIRNMWVALLLKTYKQSERLKPMRYGDAMSADTYKKKQEQALLDIPHVPEMSELERLDDQTKTSGCN